MLTKNDFAEYIRDHVLEYLPALYADARVEICHVMKANDQLKTGIAVRREGEKSGPAVYIDKMYEEYAHEGKSLAWAADLVARLYIENVGMSDAYEVSEKALCYENVKAHLMGRLVDPQLNSRFLEKIVSRPVGELALTYQVDASALSSVRRRSDTMMTIRVTKALLAQWGVTEETLFHDTMAADKAREPGLFDMGEAMMSMFGGRMPENNLLRSEETLTVFTGQVPAFYILTYRDGRFGSSLLAHKDVLKRVGERIGGGFYIIPSSIHELLIMRDDLIKASVLFEMCHDINLSEVSEEERLSDRVQHYDVATGAVENAAVWEERAKR